MFQLFPDEVKKITTYDLDPIALQFIKTRVLLETGMGVGRMEVVHARDILATLHKDMFIVAVDQPVYVGDHVIYPRFGLVSYDYVNILCSDGLVLLFPLQ